MISENKYPPHRYYLLLNKSTKEPFRIELYSKSYMLIASMQYLQNLKKDFFTLKEKLYILNLSHDVAWIPISNIGFAFRIIFFNVISPSMLQLDISKGKVTPYILRKGGF